jgi:hypothetical protein
MRPSKTNGSDRTVSSDSESVRQYWEFHYALIRGNRVGRVKPRRVTDHDFHSLPEPISSFNRATDSASVGSSRQALGRIEAHHGIDRRGGLRPEREDGLSAQTMSHQADVVPVDILLPASVRDQ